MKSSKTLSLALAGLFIGLPLVAQGQGKARSELVLKESVLGMPKGEKQEISVLTAYFLPGEKTVFHTHRFPVTVFILEGAFTLELDGRPPIVVQAGHAFVEPPNVRMTGFNRNSTEALRLVIFYTSDPDTPFLDLIQ